jgi:hypothetical protein
LLRYIIENVIEGVPVEWHVEALFIEDMANKTD